MLKKTIEGLCREPELYRLVGDIVRHLADDAEVQALVRQQSAGLAEQAMQELRDQALTADQALDRLLGRLRRRLRRR
jgi:hypothetical protein